MPLSFNSRRSKSALWLTGVFTATLILSACQPQSSANVAKTEIVKAESQNLNNWFQARFERKIG